MTVKNAENTRGLTHSTREAATRPEPSKDLPSLPGDSLKQSVAKFLLAMTIFYGGVAGIMFNSGNNVNNPGKILINKSHDPKYRSEFLEQFRNGGVTVTPDPKIKDVFNISLLQDGKPVTVSLDGGMLTDLRVAEGLGVLPKTGN